MGFGVPEGLVKVCKGAVRFESSKECGAVWFHTCIDCEHRGIHAPCSPQVVRLSARGVNPRRVLRLMWFSY